MVEMRPRPFGAASLLWGRELVHHTCDTGHRTRCLFRLGPGPGGVHRTAERHHSVGGGNLDRKRLQARVVSQMVADVVGKRPIPEHFCCGATGGRPAGRNSPAKHQCGCEVAGSRAEPSIRCHLFSCDKRAVRSGDPVPECARTALLKPSRADVKCM